MSRPRADGGAENTQRPFGFGRRNLKHAAARLMKKPGGFPIKKEDEYVISNG